MSMPAQQAHVLELLERAWRRDGTQPNLTELARQLGISYNTLREHLEALAAKGYLFFESRGSGKAPRVRLLRTSSSVPVLGDIAAGPLSEALAHPEGHLRLRGVPEGYFGLFVRGESMADYLADGDVVLLRPGLPERSGEICAVRVEQSDATLKYVDWQERGAASLQLRPHNAAYPTLQVPAKDVTIDGVFRGSFRGEPIELLLEASDVN